MDTNTDVNSSHAFLPFIIIIVFKERFLDETGEQRDSREHDVLILMLGRYKAQDRIR